MANANAKKKRRKIIIFSIIGVLVIALGVLVVMGSNREKVHTIQTEKAELKTITQVVTASGKIQPEVQVKINAEVSGEIIELPVREGQRVKRGDLLVRIKPDAYQAQLERAEASLAVAQANLQKAEAEFKRVTDLYAKNLVSTAEMDVAKATYLSAQATFAQQQAVLKESRETLGKTTIRSPMDGVISQLRSELGERVSGSQFMQGTEIMTVADLSRMEARVEVGENDVVLVTLGDTARIEVDSYPDRKFVGVVSQIANTASTRGLGTQDEITNFQVRILISAPSDVRFRPGMSMTADIETETRPGVLAIPIQSVTTRQPKEEKQEGETVAEGEAQVAKKGKTKDELKIDEVVFVITDGVAKTKVVKRGISDDSYVEITDGLTEGAEIVSGPYRAINRDLEDGAKVKIDNAKTKKTGSSISSQN
ncbi:MAG: efflux RND transporter periplasmic adaptor subunit [Ignavibacteria bacterium]|nr:efflux RND transporter periplasmic adaptor subunit [Ignavibacteria bacterium]